MKYESVLLYSGGIDSFIGFYYLDRKPQPIYFDMKTKYSKKELKYLPSLYNKEIIVDNDLSFLGSMEQEVNAHVPYRNLYLALRASAKYSDIVYICGLKDDNVSDKNKEVFEEWSNHLSKLEERKIQILSPFWDKTKLDIVQWFSNSYDKHILLNTISCYSEEDVKYCGKCQSCYRKSCALYHIGITLPFFNHEIIDYYKQRIGKGIYDVEREKSMKEYIDYVER